jgi:hypothetical protein
MGWDGTAWDGMGWDGMMWDGMGWDDVGWDGMGWAFDTGFHVKLACFQKITIFAVRFLSGTFLLPSDPRPLDSKNVPDKNRTAKIVIF